MVNDPIKMQITEELRKQAMEIATNGHNGWGNTMTLAADEIESLQAAHDALALEVDGLREDAERYRWLRSPSRTGKWQVLHRVEDENNDWYVSDFAEYLDMNIDAGRSKLRELGQ